jgi:hypothetical protein
VVIFGFVAVTEIEQHPTPCRQDDLRGVAVADWVEDDVMALRHLDSVFF